jgi:hypothetical protein
VAQRPKDFLLDPPLKDISLGDITPHDYAQIEFPRVLSHRKTGQIQKKHCTFLPSANI